MNKQTPKQRFGTHHPLEQGLTANICNLGLASSTGSLLERRVRQPAQAQGTSEAVAIFHATTALQGAALNREIIQIVRQKTLYRVPTTAQDHRLQSHIIRTDQPN